MKLKYEKNLKLDEALLFLDNKRKLYLLHRVLMIVGASVLGPGFIALLVCSLVFFPPGLNAAFAVIGFVLFVLVVTFASISAATKPRKYEAYIYSLLVPCLEKRILEDSVTYSPRKETYAILKRLPVQIRLNVDKYTYSYIDGEVGNTKFYSFCHRNYNSRRKDISDKQYPVCGRFVFFERGSGLDCNILIRGKNRRFKVPDFPFQIYSESTLVSDKETITADNIEFGSRYLNSVVTETMTSLMNEYSGVIHAYISKDFAAVYYDRYFTPFPVKLTRRADMSFFEDFRQEYRIVRRLARLCEHM